MFKDELRVDADPNKGSGYWTFRGQRRTSTGTWTTLPTTFRTQGEGETRTIPQSRGTYRVVVGSQHGYRGATSQTRYRSLDRPYRNFSCSSGGTSSTWAARAKSPVSATNPDLDCGDISSAYKPIRITGPDYHRLDADSDGWGCES